MIETISITKETGGIFARLGLTQKNKKEVLRITNNMLFYDSTLGEIGEINSDDIEFIIFDNIESSKVIKIGLNERFNLREKLNSFRQKLSDLYKNKYGAEILIFPQDVDIELVELSKILKDKLKK